MYGIPENNLYTGFDRGSSFSLFTELEIKNGK
jgi:hypothetical protein